MKKNPSGFYGYWSSLNAGQKRALADQADTSVCYLSQVANGHRKAGISLLTRLIQADSKISPEMLRPDLNIAA